MWRLGRLGVLLGVLLAGGSVSAQSKDTAVPEAPETPGGVKTPESPEEPEPEPGDARPFGESPGSEPAVVDPSLTGMVMKVGPASEDDLKRGYVSFRARLKVDLNYDFLPILNEEDFVPASIPVGADPRGTNLNFNAKQTRIFFEGGKLTLLGPLIGHISADFYGEGSSGGDFRVYEAYALVGPLLAGRKWTTFMDLEAVPDTLDFQGPGSMLATRREVLRYGNTFGPLLVQVALERPLPDLTLSNADTQEARTPLPDVTGAVEWNFGEGRHVRAAGVARWLTYYDAGGVHGTALGWGGMLSGLWTWGDTGWRASTQVHYGSGLGAYTSDVAGLGLDAVVVAPGRLEAVPTFGVFASIEPHWNEHLTSSFVYGYLEMFPLEAQPGGTLKRTHYLSGNLLVTPVRSVTFGAELLFGRRENKDGAADNAVRLIFSTRFFY
ncbi:DcaP family trimeric outer membrane transporter [Archangium lansingense]|uniref:DcaP family trimeric outer membrane transporter n=1 Tax=Archangium lansingense TaxID=2995310 RepID=A0ABT3ZY65_9BACT|nr:DcaP family trimeric outer membrane transporter [Archangium lansinium]MCY1074345.1 DcaP family trimeric outer membrane transporter [Archangium lansinium]